MPAATTAAGTFDLNDRQTSFNGSTFSYDADGNLLSDGADSYSWNARNQLVSIRQGTNVVLAYAYDALGRRTNKTINGTTTSLLYDGPNAVQETQGNTINPILTGLGIDERFARNEGATRNYFLTDALGSTVALTDPNANVTQTYQYDPYGNVSTTGSATNPYQYTGRENDGTGLYYYRARYYSPGMARFVSEDPITFAGGQNNFYAYADSNPIMYNDPLGLESAQYSIGQIPNGRSYITPCEVDALMKLEMNLTPPGAAVEFLKDVTGANIDFHDGIPSLSFGNYDGVDVGAAAGGYAADAIAIGAYEGHIANMTQRASSSSISYQLRNAAINRMEQSIAKKAILSGLGKALGPAAAFYAFSQDMKNCGCKK